MRTCCFHAKNYDAAIDGFSKVLELNRQGKASESDYADASFLIGEAYFQSKQYLSSRRHYREVLDHGAKPGVFGLPWPRAEPARGHRAPYRRPCPAWTTCFLGWTRCPKRTNRAPLAYARAKALLREEGLWRGEIGGQCRARGLGVHAPGRNTCLGVVLLKVDAPSFADRARGSRRR